MLLTKREALPQPAQAARSLVAISMLSPGSTQSLRGDMKKSGSEMNETKVVTLIEERNDSGDVSNHAVAYYTANGDLKFEAEYCRVGHLAKFDKFDVELSITVHRAQIAALCRALGNPYDMLFVIKQRYSGRRFWTISSFLREHQIEHSRWINSTRDKAPLCRSHSSLGYETPETFGREKGNKDLPTGAIPN